MFGWLAIPHPIEVHILWHGLDHKAIDHFPQWRVEECLQATVWEIHAPPSQCQQRPGPASCTASLRCTLQPNTWGSSHELWWGWGAAGGPLGWGHQSGDAKGKGSRARLRRAGLWRHEGLCVHSACVLSHSWQNYLVPHKPTARAQMVPGGGGPEKAASSGPRGWGGALSCWEQGQEWPSSQAATDTMVFGPLQRSQGPPLMITAFRIMSQSDELTWRNALSTWLRAQRQWFLGAVVFDS